MVIGFQVPSLNVFQGLHHRIVLGNPELIVELSATLSTLIRANRWQDTELMKGDKDLNNNEHRFT